MFDVLKGENEIHIEWIESMLTSSKLTYFKIGDYFIVITKSNNLELLYPKKIRKYNTLKNECGLNVDTIKYSEDNKIYDYYTASLLQAISEDLNVVFELNNDIEEYLIISVLNKKDVIYSFLHSHDNEFDLNELMKILNKEKIMSDKKESKIIDAVADKLNEFELSLTNYEYSIEDVGSNFYEVSLTHSINDSVILIQNIELSKNDEVISIGKNKGLVL